MRSLALVAALSYGCSPAFAGSGVEKLCSITGDSDCLVHYHPSSRSTSSDDDDHHSSPPPIFKPIPMSDVFTAVPLSSIRNDRYAGEVVRRTKKTGDKLDRTLRKFLRTATTEYPSAWRRNAEGALEGLSPVEGEACKAEIDSDLELAGRKEAMLRIMLDRTKEIASGEAEGLREAENQVAWVKAVMAVDVLSDAASMGALREAKEALKTPSATITRAAAERILRILRGKALLSLYAGALAPDSGLAKNKFKDAADDLAATLPYLFPGAASADIEQTGRILVALAGASRDLSKPHDYDQWANTMLRVVSKATPAGPFIKLYDYDQVLAPLEEDLSNQRLQASASEGYRKRLEGALERAEFGRESLEWAGKKCAKAAGE